MQKCGKWLDTIRGKTSYYLNIVNLLGHIIRAAADDPLRQVVFEGMDVQPRDRWTIAPMQLVLDV